MIYFKGKGQIIEKYLVEIDREALERLNVEIINNCSEITHLKYESFMPLKGIDNLRIRNYNVKTRREISKNININEKITVYDMEYDLYNFPYLSNLIIALLQGQIDILDDIMEPHYYKENVPLSYKKNEIIKKLIELSDNKKEKRAEYLERLKEISEKLEYNANQIPVYDYYKKVQKLIHFELVDSINLNDKSNFESFFNENNVQKK